MRGLNRIASVGFLIGGAIGVCSLTIGTAGAVPATPKISFAKVTTPPKLFAPGRVFAAGAGDESGKRTVVYGGQIPGTGNAFGDTWVNEADGTWKAMCGTTVPGATAACGPGTRDGLGMASAPGGVVLFGGFHNQIGGSMPYGDTWRWNGTAWSQVCTTATCGPGDRALMAMAGNGNSAVMFGGLSTSGLRDDTWVFDGATWTEVCGQTGVPCGPTGLAGASMAWDGTHFVLFGGADLTNNSAPTDDTWIFGGQHWTKVCGTSATLPHRLCGPSPRDLSAFAFAMNPVASARGAILAEGGDIFGNGATQHIDKDVWFFDDARWTRLTPPWNAAPVSFPNSGAPPAGPAPLLGVMASKPALCEVVYLAANVTVSANPPTLAGNTFLAGSAPWTAAKPNCDQPEKAQRPPVPVVVATSTTTTTTAPATPTTVVAPAAATLPRTGSAALGLNAAVGVAFVALGALALGALGARGRRRTQ